MAPRFRLRATGAAACTAAFLGTCAATAAWAGPPASVTFVHPETYTDAAYDRPYAGDKQQAEVQRDISRHLQQLAERGLPQGETLQVEVLDIDLAGRFEPWRQPGGDLRILRDNTWPKMTLRYTLTHDGEARPAAPHEEILADQNYLMEVNHYPNEDHLRYEKAMLDDWFAHRVAGR